MFEIRTFRKSDTEGVIELVLHCQNDGSRPILSVKNQPELLRIQEIYIETGGGFWVAAENGRIAGSVGLMNSGSGIGIMKKFFVYEPYRSEPHHLGRQLYRVLLDFAIAHGFRQILLDTPANTTRAHIFYRKAGFEPIKAADLPIRYETPYADSDFFRLMLPGPGI